MTAMTGLPSQSSPSSPICMARDRCPIERRSSGANQRADRRSSGFFLAMGSSFVETGARRLLRRNVPYGIISNPMARKTTTNPGCRRSTTVRAGRRAGRRPCIGSGKLVSELCGQLHHETSAHLARRLQTGIRDHQESGIILTWSSDMIYATERLQSCRMVGAEQINQ